MDIINPAVKRLVLDAVITALHIEYVDRHHCPPEGQQFPDFLDSFGANHGEILKIFGDCYPQRPWLVEHVDRYPNFWVDLGRNIGYEALPRTVRPERTVT